MAGTQEGGKRAAATNKQRYGLNYYKVIGRKGGSISTGGGFAMNRELAVEAGRKGGKAFRRPKEHRAPRLPKVELPTNDAPAIPVPIFVHDARLTWNLCPECDLRFAFRVAYQSHYIDEHLEEL